MATIAPALSSIFMTDSFGNTYIYATTSYTSNDVTSYYIYKVSPSGTIVKYIQVDYEILSLCNNGGYLYAVYAIFGSSQSDAATIVVDVYSTELSFVASASYVVSIPDSSYTSTSSVTLVALNVPDSDYIYIFYWISYNNFTGSYQNSNSFDISSLIFYQPSGSSSFDSGNYFLISDNYIVGVESTSLYSVAIDGADYNLVSSVSIPSQYSDNGGSIRYTPVLVGTYVYAPVIPTSYPPPYSPSILIYSLPYLNAMPTYIISGTPTKLSLVYSGADYFYGFASGTADGESFNDFVKFGLYPNIYTKNFNFYVNTDFVPSDDTVVSVISEYPYNSKVPVTINNPSE